MNEIVQKSAPEIDSDEINISALLDVVYLDRKLVGLIAIIVTLLGFGFAFFATPVYEADLAIQIEDVQSSAKSMLGDASSLFDTKAAVTSEMVIMGSRMVLSKAVDNLALNIVAYPKYLPLIGRWLSSRSTALSNPMMGGYVWGSEVIEVAKFTIPEILNGKKFTVIADGEGGFELIQNELGLALKGSVGAPAVYDTAMGKIELFIPKLEAKAGGVFILQSSSRLNTIKQLQSKLVIAEKGRMSGVMALTLEGDNPVLISKILNEIGHEYIRQNVDRKSEEAEKSIAFLNKQLPEMRQNLETAEDKYNSLRNEHGIIDIGAEGTNLLQQDIAIETKLVELKQKREELLTRYTALHPSVANIDAQIPILESQKMAIIAQIKKLPSLEQEVLRMTRDVKVNTELYTALLNTLQSLNLIKASRIGNARIIDPAVIPENAIKPNRGAIRAMAVLIGLLMGVIVAFIRKAMRAGIDDPKVIERATALPVYATILESKLQEELSKKINNKEQGILVLAQNDPNDFSIESLRSFRVALQFAMLDAKNNRVMITGATPGVGKSFIATNLAAVLAQAGKRVLLIDMDLHKGHLNQYFGLGRENGLSELLVGEMSLGQVVKKNVFDNLDFISAGIRVQNPSQLLLNERLLQIFEQVNSQYDIVLVDAPPILLVSDVVVIGAHIDTTFVVVRDGVSTLADLHLALKRMEQARIGVKGALFNGQLKRVSKAYGYGYGYNYKRNS